MKIGIYSGSFNPIHTGHEMLANYIANNCDIDELWLLVTPQNPLKEKKDLISDNHRLQMVSLVAQNYNNIKASGFEFNLPQPTYTYTTLCHLKEKYPQNEFTLIIGSDNWTIFNKWKDHSLIISQFGLIIYPRPGYRIDETTLPQNVKFLKDAPIMDLSSTTIRNAIIKKLDTSKMLNKKVACYISSHNLYH